MLLWSLQEPIQHSISRSGESHHSLPINVQYFAKHSIISRQIGHPPVFDYWLSNWRLGLVLWRFQVLLLQLWRPWSAAANTHVDPAQPRLHHLRHPCDLRVSGCGSGRSKGTPKLRVRRCQWLHNRTSRNESPPWIRFDGKDQNHGGIEGPLESSPKPCSKSYDSRRN